MPCGQKWLARVIHFLTNQARRLASCQHRPFFSQVECADNLVFRHRAALDALAERLLDANRAIGKPNKLGIIYGRKISGIHPGKLKTAIHDLHFGNPAICSDHMNDAVKQCVRDRRVLRTGATKNDVADYGAGKSRAMHQSRTWSRHI